MLGVILTIVGYVVAVFAAGNILLPLFWAWPKALRLQRQGSLRSPIPVFRFLVPALIWALILWGSYALVNWLVGDASTYTLGLIVGSLQNLRLVFRPNEHMEADFNDTYGEYLRVPSQL